MDSLLKFDKKFRLLQLTLFSVFVAIFFSFFSCSKQSENPFNLSKDERAWMEDFFRGVMIQEDAIYTLWGTKPFTRIIINYYTSEDKQTFINQMTEEQKKNAILTADYHLGENWERWEKMRDRFPINRRYLFFKKPHPHDSKLALLYFVDAIKLAATLQENYELFSRETDMEFDPMQVVCELENGSEFWEQVFDKSTNNSALIGILFGYGIKNAFCFQWKWWPSAEFELVANTMTHRFVNDSKMEGEAKIEKLPIPTFASFFDDDEMVEKYTRERDRIKKIYQGQDFLDLTLSKLTRG